MSQPIKGRAAIFVNISVRTNKNLAADTEYLLPVKFRQIPFSGFWEVEKVKN